MNNELLDAFDKFVGLLKAEMLKRGMLDLVETRGVDMLKLRKVGWTISNAFYIYKTNKAILASDTEHVWNVWTLGAVPINEEDIKRIVNKIYGYI